MAKLGQGTSLAAALNTLFCFAAEKRTDPNPVVVCELCDNDIEQDVKSLHSHFLQHQDYKDFECFLMCTVHNYLIFTRDEAFWHLEAGYFWSYARWRAAYRMTTLEESKNSIWTAEFAGPSNPHSFYNVRLVKRDATPGVAIKMRRNARRGQAWHIATHL
jgi:hypothetical protein